MDGRTDGWMDGLIDRSSDGFTCRPFQVYLFRHLYVRRSSQEVRERWIPKRGGSRCEVLISAGSLDRLIFYFSRVYARLNVVKNNRRKETSVWKRKSPALQIRYYSNKHARKINENIWNDPIWSVGQSVGCCSCCCSITIMISQVIKLPSASCFHFICHFLYFVAIWRCSYAAPFPWTWSAYFVATDV